MADPDGTARRLASGVEPTDTRWSEGMPWPGASVRRAFCIEGETTTDGRLIALDALTWDDRPVPVTTRQGDGFDMVGVVGKAERVKRKNGLITARIYVHPVYGEGIDVDDFNVHMECDDVKSEPARGGVKTFLSCRLRGLFLSKGPSAWPSLNVVEAAAPADIFTAAYPLGVTYGPGAAVRDCTRCGVLVRDEDEFLELHRKVHAQGWTR